jgi:hypothetical protein
MSKEELIEKGIYKNEAVFGNDLVRLCRLKKGKKKRFGRKQFGLKLFGLNYWDLKNWV